jgi:hypothetical protein
MYITCTSLGALLYGIPVRNAFAVALWLNGTNLRMFANPFVKSLVTSAASFALPAYPIGALNHSTIFPTTALEKTPPCAHVNDVPSRNA